MESWSYSVNISAVLLMILSLFSPGCFFPPQVADPSLNTTKLAPKLTLPASATTISGNSVTYQWEAIPTATDYSLWVTTTPNFASGSVKRSGKLGNVTSYTDGGYPNKGTTYYWKVYAYTADGWGPASEVRSFVNGAD